MPIRFLGGFMSWVLLASVALAQESSQILPNPHGFSMTLWAREPLLRNPVALSFDDQGHLFVVETSRRGTVDIDIRSHKDWAYDDLQNQSIDQLRVFFHEKMSPERSDENASWLRDRNGDGSHDYRDLETMKERVYRLQDTDGDGVADESLVFAEGFNEEFNGVIAGVMPWADDVWVTIYPDLWRFKDRDHNGIADPNPTRTRGFGVHAAYDGHDIHGLTLGPEGKIYFSVGDNGFSVVTLEGKRLHYPNTGGVLRMNPDGSELEVFAYGLRNVQEIAFDQYGNLFSVDNDGDIEDERERFVYISEGSDSGWRLNWQFRNQSWTRSMDQPYYNPWIHEKMWIPFFPDQPAHITPPISNYSVGPGGFKYNPGTALNASYQGYFFLAQFPVQKITAFTTQAQGAGFEMVNEHVFHFGLMASAMNFGPDGAMYIADWDGKWQPNEKGAIHRLDDPAMAAQPIRQEVEQLLNEGFATRDTQELLLLLGHADQRIRQRAQGQLASRQAGPELLRLATRENAPQLARIHALWGLIEMQGDGLLDLGSQLPIGDSDPEIRAQSAKVIGDLRLTASGERLVPLLENSRFPRVQSYAALAAGKLRDAGAMLPLVALLETNNNRDPFLRHAGTMGLVGCASPRQLETLRKHSAVAVRIAAVNALRRQQSDYAASFLDDDALVVVREAARAIHDDFSIEDALPELAALLDSTGHADDEAVGRRVINANLRLGRPSNGKRLLNYALDDTRPVLLRQEALEALGVWNRRPYLDRVTGRARNLPPRDPHLGDNLITNSVPQLLADTSPGIAETVTRIIRKNGLSLAPEQLLAWINDGSQSETLRVEALRILANQNPEQLPRALRSALQDDQAALRLTALGLEADTNPVASRNRHRDLSAYSLAERQLLISRLANDDSQDAVVLAKKYIGELNRGTLTADMALDVLKLGREHKNNAVKEHWQSISGEIKPKLEEMDYRYSLMGGDPGRGKEVYAAHVAAQCVRCHNAGGKGKQVGPVLDGLGQRAKPEELLEALLNPSAVIAQGYQTVSVETTDGDTYDGVVVEETPSRLVLGLPVGGTQTIQKENIEFRQASQLSAMPSMKGILTPYEIRDLVAYLQTL